MYRPKEVAERFGVTTATLRLWSTHFADYLSPAAQKATTENGGAAQRRYVEDDLRVLSHAKTLLAEGLTYEEVRCRLGESGNRNANEGSEVISTSGSCPAEEATSKDLVLSEPARLVLAALQDSIRAKEETLSSKNETIVALTTTVATLQNQVSDLKQELATTQASRPQPASWAPWWKRLFGWASPQMRATRSAN